MLSREFAAARRRDEREHDRDVRLAWYGEALARTKRLPKLSRLLQRQPAFTAVSQTQEQMRSAVMVIAGQFGLRVTRGKERIH